MAVTTWRPKASLCKQISLKGPESDIFTYFLKDFVTLK
jgi:hypothetical protein